MKNDFDLYFNYYLDQLEHEIKLYNNEADIWTAIGETKNSAANLVLHIIGNLNHFIGATLGNSGYVRARDLEFSTKNHNSEQFSGKAEATQRGPLRRRPGIPRVNSTTWRAPQQSSRRGQ